MPGVVDIPQGAWYKPDEEGIDHGGNIGLRQPMVESEHQRLRGSPVAGLVFRSWVCCDKDGP